MSYEMCVWKKMRRIRITLAFVLPIWLSNSAWARDLDVVAQSNRWMVTEAQQGIAPPWKLLWDKSPISQLLERFGAGAYGRESPNRHLVETPNGLAVVMKRTLYLLDKETGSTLWSLKLKGNGIMDWKVAGDILVYAASEPDTGHGTRGVHAALDLKQRKEIWSREEIPDGYYQPEWVILYEHKWAIFGTNKDGDQHTNISVQDLKTGKLQWEKPNGIERGTLIPASWFAYKGHIYSLITSHPEGGLYLRKYDLETGEVLATINISGKTHEGVGNLYVANAVNERGDIFFKYETLISPKDAPSRFEFSLLAHNIDQRRQLWETPLVTYTEKAGKYAGKILDVMNIALEGKVHGTLAILMRPNIFITVDEASGNILRKEPIAGYQAWPDHSPILYGPPYLFTTALRALKDGAACDLVAINIESGSIVWSYEIDRGKDVSAGEALNFVYSGDTVYMSRSNGRIMAFRVSGM